ncbi:MAG: hypothetical protein AB1468_04870 [Candidatus Micrarchaeota archaeon]
MITGGKLISVEARREKEDAVSGLSVNINLDSVAVKGNDVEINYTYVANYEDDVGYLKISGVLYATEDAKTAAEIAKSWPKEEKGKEGKEKAQRKLPDGFAEMVLNSINYTCGTNGILVVRPLNLSPPIMPPRIELAKQPRTPPGGGTKAG